MPDERRANLYGRLRREPSTSTVPGTLPILFFGDLFAAEVASVGLNPSDQEYVTKAGQMLAGSAQRFATLDSVRAEGRASLSDAQCDEAIEWMRGYYDEGKPVYGSWFNALSRVVEGFGASFRAHTAAHLDLVQESTSPVWSELPVGEKEALLARDLPFLEWEIRAFAQRAVICTGKTVSVHVRRAFDVQVAEEGALARIKWWVGRADVDGREVGFVGWNYPLARATGLGASGESELGRLLAEKLGLAAPPKTQPTRSETSPSASLPRSADPAEPATAVSSTPEAVSAKRDSRLKGVTHAAWDGVSLPTLRYWLRWWQDETKSAGRIENGWGREEQIARISAEIVARDAARGRNAASPQPDVAAQVKSPPDPNRNRSDDAFGAARAHAARRRRLYRESASPHELLEMAERRRDAVREYLEWAKANDNEKWTFRMSARPDIRRAAESAALFPEGWWGVVVYSCFDSTIGAAAVAGDFQQPLPPPEAEAVLEAIDFPRGSVGGHRIQPAFRGAKQALVAACADHELFYDVLHGRDDFDTRYLHLRAAKLRQWGRTTSFDLLLRAGALGAGGQQYKPDYAYFGGSTGPKSGFARVFGEALDTDERVGWAESLLQHWAEAWQGVCERVGADWDSPPLEPCDQENFLCIYQERR